MIIIYRHEYHVWRCWKAFIYHLLSAAAMNQLTRNLACEWAKDNIRTNSVAPWYTKTSLVEHVMFSNLLVIIILKFWFMVTLLFISFSSFHWYSEKYIEKIVQNFVFCCRSLVGVTLVFFYSWTNRTSVALNLNLEQVEVFYLITRIDWS